MADLIDVDLKGVEIKALYAAPQAPSAAGVVVTYHREGLDDFTRWKIDQLAAAGFHAIAPNHYHTLPEGIGFKGRRPYLDDQRMADDIAGAADWLMRSRQVNPARLAVLGPCMGGRTALVAAECYPELWACCCVWYGGEVFETLGASLPHPGSIVRLRRIACEVLGYFGNLDTHPTPSEVDMLEARLREAQVPHRFTRFADAGHGFLNPWHSRYHPQAAEASWADAIRELRARLLER
jgi:carboxymethylenebutenolidase